MSFNPEPDYDGSFEYEVTTGLGRNGAYGILASGLMVVRSAGLGVEFRNAAGSAVFVVTESGASFTDLDLGDGTAALPSLAFLNEESTGVYRPGAGKFGISVLGTQSGFFDGTGLRINGSGSAATPAVRVGEETSGLFLAGGATLAFSTGSVEVFRILSTLDIEMLIGTTTTPGGHNRLAVVNTNGQVSGNVYAIRAQTTSSVSNNASLFGIQGEASIDSGAFNAVNGIVGIRGIGTYAGSISQSNVKALFAGASNDDVGTVTDLYGLFVGSLGNGSTGTVTSGYGIFVSTPDNSGGGVFSTFYGLRIADPTGVPIGTAWALYIDGGNSRFPAGSQTTPSFSFGSDPTTGIFSSGGSTVEITCAGVKTFEVNPIGAGVISGTAAAPSYGFLSDVSSGIYLIALSTIGISLASSEVVRFSTLGMGIIDGLAATPSLFFTADPTDGFFRNGLHDVRVSLNGAGRTAFLLDSTLVPAGSVALPGLAFMGDTNTGLSVPSADSLIASAGGSEIGRFETAGLGVKTGATPTSTLQVAGSIASAFTSVAVDTTLLITHSFVGVDASGAARTVTLPTAVGISGREYTIKKTDSSLNTVTVDGAGAETIDGALTVVLAVQYAKVVIVSDGANWLIKGS